MFDIKQFDIEKYDKILARGLSKGLGDRASMVCIEAAICETLGLSHSDDPQCVAISVRNYKIAINDSFYWTSPHSRARGLRDLGIAQLGSLGVVDDIKFSQLLADKTIKVILPKLLRVIFAGNTDILTIADRCEREGSWAAAGAAAEAAGVAAEAVEAAAGAAAEAAGVAAEAVEAAARATAWAAGAAAGAAGAAAARAAWVAAEAAWVAAEAAGAAARAAARAAGAAKTEEYLLLSTKIALEILVELKSPGVKLLGL